MQNFDDGDEKHYRKKVYKFNTNQNTPRVDPRDNPGMQHTKGTRGPTGAMMQHSKSGRQLFQALKESSGPSVGARRYAIKQYAKGKASGMSGEMPKYNGNQPYDGGIVEESPEMWRQLGRQQHQTSMGNLFRDRSGLKPAGSPQHELPALLPHISSLDHIKQPPTKLNLDSPLVKSIPKHKGSIQSTTAQIIDHYFSKPEINILGGSTP